MPAINSQSLLGRMLKKSLDLLISKDTVVPVLRGPVKGMKWIVGSSVHSCWLGSYEFSEQQAILRHLKPGMAAYDIGAHVGFYTLMFSKIVGPSGEVHAFEPYPDNIRFLQRHIELNKLHNVVINSLAVSNKSGEIEFYKSYTAFMGNIMNKLEWLDSLKVNAINLDQYININGNRPPDFVKMDVEGAESLVLAGMEELINIKKPILFISLHGEEVAKKCSIILKKYKYKTFDLEGNAVDIYQNYYNEIIAL
jgi:FkbM family methyltransferase